MSMPHIAYCILHLRAEGHEHDDCGHELEDAEKGPVFTVGWNSRVHIVL